MRCARLLMLGLMLALPAVSRGEVLTFAFEGNVDTITNLTGFPVDIEEEDRAIFTYTFDSEAPHSSLSPDSYDGISSSLRIGNIVFTTNVPPSLTVQLAAPQIGFPAMFSVGSPYIAGLQTSGWTVFSLFSDANVFPDDSLPVTPPVLSLFSRKTFQVILRGPTLSPEIAISGSIDSSYAVPEPLSAIFMSIGALLVAGLRRPRR